MRMLQNWSDIVTLTALLLCLASFGLFVIEALLRFGQMRSASKVASCAAQSVQPGAQGFVAEDLSKSFDAAAKLVAAFNAATPGVVALVSSILFLSAAAYIVKPVSPPPKANIAAPSPP